MKLKPDAKQKKQAKLNHQIEEGRAKRRDRHYQPWKIDFAEKVGVTGENIGILKEASIKKIPENDAGKIEKQRRTVTRRDFGNPAKNQRVY